MSLAMIDIADNIQDLNNSLHSAIPRNRLAINTACVDPSDLEKDSNDENKVKEDQVAMLRLLEMLQDAFHNENESSEHCEENEELMPLHEKESNALFESLDVSVNAEQASGDVVTVKDVIELSNSSSMQLPMEDAAQHNNCRFVPEQGKLNELAMEQLQISSRDSTQHNANLGKVNCNGTWSFVVLRDVQAGLDKKQQTAC